MTDNERAELLRRIEALEQRIWMLESARPAPPIVMPNLYRTAHNPWVTVVGTG